MWWLSPPCRPGGLTCTLGTLSSGLGGGGARWVVQPGGLDCSALCHPAWAVAVPGRWSSRPDLHARHSVERPGRWRGPADRPAGRSALSARPGRWRTQAVVWPADLHARHSVERHGRWRVPGCRPAGRSALGARPGVWRAQEGHPAGWTCTLSTLSSDMDGDGVRRVIQRPDLHAWHFAARPVWWRSLAVRQGGLTCPLGTLSSSLGSGGARQVDQPAAQHSGPGLGGGGAGWVVQPGGLAHSALCRPAWAVTVHGG